MLYLVNQEYAIEKKYYKYSLDANKLKALIGTQALRILLIEGLESSFLHNTLKYNTNNNTDLWWLRLSACQSIANLHSRLVDCRIRAWVR